MTLKFRLRCRQVRRSSVGRVSDCTMLRSVVRGQGSSPGAGNFFIWFCHHIFFLADKMFSMSSCADAHILYQRVDCTLLLKM